MSRRLPAVLAAFTLAALLTASAGAADPAFDKALRASLAEVHNKGADLYNTAKDYPGAYRIYEGALLTAKPLLAHRAATQKAIDDGLAAAGKEADPARKAYLLHETIEKVRADLNDAAPAPMKAPEVKKTDETKKTPEVKKTDDPKKGTPPPAAGAKGVRGVVTLKGKPVADADLSFVSLDAPAPRVISTKTNADGAYTADVPAGRYAVTISATANGKALLPARYATTDTSGLTFTAAAGANTFDIRLE